MKMNDEWTDGSGKALSKIASILTKKEKAIHDNDEEYFSNPRLYIQDMNTGASVIITTDKDNVGGKTQGHGYRKCSSVRQRVPHKVSPKLQMSVLLDMIVGMLVPNEEDRIGPLGIAAYNRIAEAVMNAQNADDWMKNNGKNITHVKDIIERLSDMTWTERSGDSLLNVKIIPLHTIDTTFKNRMEGRITHEEKQV